MSPDEQLRQLERELKLSWVELTEAYNAHWDSPPEDRVKTRRRWQECWNRRQDLIQQHNAIMARIGR